MALSLFPDVSSYKSMEEMTSAHAHVQQQFPPDLDGARVARGLEVFDTMGNRQLNSFHSGTGILRDWCQQDIFG